MVIKDFFKNVKSAFEGIHEANKELASGIKNDLKEFRTDMKDVTKTNFPNLAKPIETVDRANQAVRNVMDATNPINILKREFNLKEIEIKKGDHLIVQRFGYTHHALALNQYDVIHYSNGSVKMDSMTDFAGGSTVNVLETSLSYPIDQVISRAYSRRGESSYNVAFNNCEQFVTWCRSGGKYSDSI